MSDSGEDIPQPFSVRQRGREWEIVVSPLRGKPTMVAHEPNESVAETIAEECNAAVVAYAEAVMVRERRRQAAPKPKAVREPKRRTAVRATEASANQDADATARRPGDRDALLRQILALPVVKKAIRDGELSLQSLKKDSYSRLLRRQELLSGNTGLHSRKTELQAGSIVAAAGPN